MSGIVTCCEQPALMSICGISTIGRNVAFSMSSSLVSARERLLTFV